MRWSEVYDSDADEVQRLQDEVEALRAKVEAVRRVVAQLEDLPRVHGYLKADVMRVQVQTVCSSLREALGDTESDHG